MLGLFPSRWPYATTSYNLRHLTLSSSIVVVSTHKHPQEDIEEGVYTRRRTNTYRLHSALPEEAHASLRLKAKKKKNWEGRSSDPDLYAANAPPRALYRLLYGEELETCNGPVVLRVVSREAFVELHSQSCSNASCRWTSGYCGYATGRQPRRLALVVHSGTLRQRDCL